MPKPTEPPLQYIANRVEVDENECWNWKLATNEHGYGTCRYASRQHFAHRLSYMIFIDNIPSDKQIDHLCRNTRCVNPLHLEAVTPLENIRRIPRNRDRPGYSLYLQKNNLWTAAIRLRGMNKKKAFRSRDRATAEARAKAWLEANPQH